MRISESKGVDISRSGKKKDGLYFSKKRKKPWYIRYLPILHWLPAYKWRENIKGDLTAAVTVGCMVVPQGMAYSLLAGLPPIHGLYAASIPLLVFSFLGTSRVQSSGPTAMDSLLTFSALESILSSTELDNEAKVVGVALVLAFTAGLIQLLMGFLRLGVMVNFLSFSVMSGFTTGAAIIIAMSQMKYIFGIQDVPRFNGFAGQVRSFWNVLSRLDETNPWTVVLSVTAITILGFLKWWKKKRFNPATATSRQKAFKLVADLSALLVTVLTAIMARLYDVNGINVRSSREQTTDTSKFVDVVGDVPPGLPSPQFPDYGFVSSRVDSLMFGSSTIALIAFMELYAIGNVYAEKRGYKIDANQELIAMGSSNIAGAFFGSYPVGGSFSRTAVNADAGAITLLANFGAGVIVILSLLALSSLFFYIPMSGLASIIEVAVVNLVKVNDFKEAWRLRRSDFTVMVVTFLFTFLVGIPYGIAVGVVVSIILTVKASAFPKFAMLGQAPNGLVFQDLTFHSNFLIVDKVAVARFDASLFFANTEFFRSKLLALARAGNKRIVLDCASMTFMDLQALHTIRRLLADLKQEGVTLYWAHVRGRIRKLLHHSGIFDEMGTEHVFPDLSDAVMAATQSLYDVESLHEHIRPYKQPRHGPMANTDGTGLGDALVTGAINGTTVAGTRYGSTVSSTGGMRLSVMNSSGNRRSSVKSPMWSSNMLVQHLASLDGGGGFLDEDDDDDDDDDDNDDEVAVLTSDASSHVVRLDNADDDEKEDDEDDDDDDDDDDEKHA